MNAKLLQKITPLTSRVDDIEYDKKILKDYKGAYLHACRESGTNIFLLDSKRFNYNLPPERFNKSIDDVEVYFIGNNKHFHSCDANSNIKELSKESVLSCISEFKQSLIKRYEYIAKLDIFTISLELERLMSYRNWRSKMLEEFENQYNSPIRRLRNSFDYTKLKKGTLEEIQDQLYRLLLI